MLFVRTCRGVLVTMRTHWAVWAISTMILSLLLRRAGAAVTTALIAVSLGPMLSLMTHEYGHARVARIRGATQLSLVRSRWSVAVCHERLDATSHALIALGGPLSSLAAAGILAGLAAVTSIDQLDLTALIVGAGAASALPWAHDGRTLAALLRNATRRTSTGAGITTNPVTAHVQPN